jgi:hypothetical protein
VLQVTLVSDEHDNDVRVRMIPKLLQPPHHIDIRRMFRNIVHQQGPDCTTVVSTEQLTLLAKTAHEDCGEHCVRGCDGAVTLLACSVPYLRLHCLAVNIDGAGRELDANCGFGLQVELVTSEPQEDLVVNMSVSASTDR